MARALGDSRLESAAVRMLMKTIVKRREKKNIFLVVRCLNSADDGQGIVGIPLRGWTLEREGRIVLDDLFSGASWLC